MEFLQLTHQSLRLLQSCKAAEQAGCFETKTLDIDDLNVKHPDFIVTVVPPHCPAPPKKPDEMRVYYLSDALSVAFKSCYDGNNVGCSIILYPGLYVDPWTPPKYLPACHAMNTTACLKERPFFSLEIIGLGHVRIIQINDMPYVYNMSLTSRNLSFFDRRYKHREDFVIYVDSYLHTECCNRPRKTSLTLLDVNVHAPESCVLLAMGLSASVRATRCNLSRCLDVVYSDHGGIIDLSHCRIFRPRQRGGIASRAKLIAADSSFIDAPIELQNQSRGIFENCEFQGNWVPGVQLSAKGEGLTIGQRSTANVTGCFAKNFYRAFDVLNSGSFAEFVKCKATDLHTFVTAQSNASANIFGNTLLQIEFVANMILNTEGSIVLTGNRSLHQPQIAVDRLKNNLKHDFEDANIVKCTVSMPCDDLPSRKEKSAKMKDIEAKRGSGRDYWNECHQDLATGYIKQCNYCKIIDGKRRDQDIKTKFLSCGKCKWVCYCSKQCQEDDWPDHKMKCKMICKQKPKL